MSNVAHTVAFGVFFVIAMAIVFVKSGQNNQLSGGQQTGIILDSASGGAAKVVTALEGGA